MKKLLTILIGSFIILSNPVVASAQYGQEVLGEKEPEEVVVVHPTKDAALGDYLNPVEIGIGLFVASGVLYFLSKRTRKSGTLYSA